MECEEFILLGWSPPDDPAQALPAESQHVPSYDDDGGDVDVGELYFGYQWYS